MSIHEHNLSKTMYHKMEIAIKYNTYPLLSMSNILNATLKLDSGMLSNVTKKIYLSWCKIKTSRSQRFEL